MAKKELTKRQLQEFIDATTKKAFLSEDYDGGYGDYGDYGGGGGGYGGGHDAGNIRGLGGIAGMFLNPLLDVGRTAMKTVKGTAIKLKNFGAGVVSSIIAGALPSFMTADKNNKGGKTVSGEFNKFRTKDQRELAALEGQYKDVIERTRSALANDDVWGITFLLDPVSVIAASLVSKAPGVAFGVLDAASAGMATNILNRIRRPTSVNPYNYYDHDDHGGWKKHVGYLGEETEEQIKADPKEVAKVANDPRIIHALEGSKMIQDMKAAGARILADRANSILNAKTVEEMSRALGKNIQQDIETAIKKDNIKQSDHNKFIQDFLLSLKQEFKTKYIQQLNAMAASNPGMSEAIEMALKQIK